MKKIICSLSPTHIESHSRQPLPYPEDQVQTVRTYRQEKIPTLTDPYNFIPKARAAMGGNPYGYKANTKKAVVGYKYK